MIGQFRLCSLHVYHQYPILVVCRYDYIFSRSTLSFVGGLFFLMLSIVPPFHGELRFSDQLTDGASVHSVSMRDVTLREICDFLTYPLQI